MCEWLFAYVYFLLFFHFYGAGKTRFGSMWKRGSNKSFRGIRCFVIPEIFIFLRRKFIALAKYQNFDTPLAFDSDKCIFTFTAIAPRFRQVVLSKFHTSSRWQIYLSLHSIFKVSMNRSQVYRPAYLATFSIENFNSSRDLFTRTQSPTLCNAKVEHFNFLKSHHPVSLLPWKNIFL